MLPRSMFKLVSIGYIYFCNNSNNKIVKYRNIIPQGCRKIQGVEIIFDKCCKFFITEVISVP